MVQITYNAQGIAHEFTDGPSLLLKPNASQKMVRNSLHLFHCDFICDDWQSMIELHCIAIDDLTIELPCYLNG